MKPHDNFNASGGLGSHFSKGCLLLLIGHHPAHGYDLMARMRALGVGRLDRGGLYRTLNALERDGAVTSTVVHSGRGPSRRVYELTAAGRRWLEEWAQTVQELLGLTSKCLGLYGKLTIKDRDREGTMPARAG